MARSETSSRKKVIVVRRSCLTGKIVWFHRCTTENAGRIAYWRACKKEIERVRNWPKTVAERSRMIMEMLTAVTSRIPIGTEMTPEQKAAARRLKAIAQQKEPCYMEFYNHIMEERRRRDEDHRIRQQMREREERERLEQNRNYDK